MQTIYKGIDHLSETVRGSRKILLVAGRSYSYLDIKEEIDALDVPVVRFDQFTPNPLYEDVCKGVNLFNREGCDTILALGGGSSIDVAKCIKLYCKMSNDRLYLEQDCCDTGIRLIAIPTTAGSGSESTRYAVIYFKGKKQSVTHDSIIPDYAILEPKVLKTLPLYQKKCSMMDALCQAIESWWSINSTDESKELSKQSVEIITRCWHEYIFENTEKAAAAIMKAANLAGQAICITQTTAPHAFSYKITSLYGLPHGHAVAVCLPGIWEYMSKHPEQCSDDRGYTYLQEVFIGIAHAMGCVNTADAIARFRMMLDDCQLTYPQSRHLADDILELTRSVNPIRLSNNPVFLDEEAIGKLYASILNL